MSELLSAQNDDYRQRKALESDLADLIERVKRLEAARPPPQDDALLNQEQAASPHRGEAAHAGDVEAPGKRPTLQQDWSIGLLQEIRHRRLARCAMCNSGPERERGRRRLKTATAGDSETPRLPEARSAF